VYAFARTPRWLVRHVITVVILALFCLAGFWQLHRLHERRVHNAQVRAALARPPADANRNADAAPYRRVTATGLYDAKREVILRSQVLDDNAGNDVLTPLRLPDGHAVLVDRGWVPIEMDRPDDRRTEPPAGTVRITGIVMPPERKRPLSPDDPKRGELRTVTYVKPTRIARQLPYPLATGYYVLLSKQRPAARTLPRYEAMEPLTDGPHLSYAVQWFLFLAVGAIGYVALLRRVAQRPARSPGEKT
jgi:surfeit locus 1 family protein